MKQVVTSLVVLWTLVLAGSAQDPNLKLFPRNLICLYSFDKKTRKISVAEVFLGDRELADRHRSSMSIKALETHFLLEDQNKVQVLVVIRADSEIDVDLGGKRSVLLEKCGKNQLVIFSCRNDKVYLGRRAKQEDRYIDLKEIRNELNTEAPKKGRSK